MKQFNRMTGLVALMVALFCSPPVLASGGRLTDEEARGLAIKFVRESLTSDQNRFLDTKRREDLEDSLLGLQVQIVGKIGKGALFYEVHDVGYEISENEVISHTSDHGFSRWIVAVSPQTGKSYGLYGFREAKEGFDKLIDDVRLLARNPVLAQSCALLYFRTVVGGDDDIVHSDLHLRRIIESEFYNSQLPEGKWMRQFDSWWKSFRSQTKGLSLSASSVAKEGGYLVTVYRVKRVPRPIPRPLDGFKVTPNPRLEQWSILVTHKGNCKVTQVKTVFEK